MQTVARQTEGLPERGEASTLYQRFMIWVQYRLKFDGLIGYNLVFIETDTFFFQSLSSSVVKYMLTVIVGRLSCNATLPQAIPVS